jgi:hypothetical protein
MTSNMTSHATIGNSTFARPRSADSTMSIDGPSDFTENMFEYMKGNKQATTKKASRVKPKAKPARKRHLKQEESGIIIESPSEFSDDLIDCMIDKKDISSPKSEKSDPDGPSDFTANLAGYMGGIEAYSPSKVTGVIDARETISSTPAHEDSIGHITGTKAQSPVIPFNLIHEDAVVRDNESTLPPKVVAPTRDLDVDLGYVPKLNKNLVINGPSNLAGLTAFINGTHARYASVHTTSSPKVNVRPMSSPAKGENFDEEGRAAFAADLAEYINEKRKESMTTTTSSITKENNPKEKSKESMATTASSINKENNPNATKNVVPAIKTPTLITKTTSAKTVSTTNKDIIQPSGNEQEAELHKQIAQLQAQLLKRDGTITGLQNSLSVAENKCVRLESDLEDKKTIINKLQTFMEDKNTTINKLQTSVEDKNTIINKLQTSVKQSNQEFQALEHELLIHRAEADQRPELEKECELLEAALNNYADELKTQHAISTQLAAEKQQLEKIISGMEEREEKREEEWQARVALLLQEVERRGAACMELWGQLEHPGEKDARGRQKYTYKYVKKGTRGA